MIPFALLAAASLAPRAIQAVRALASVSKALLKSESSVSCSRHDEVPPARSEERRRVIFAYNSLNQQTSPAGQVFDAKGQRTTDGTRTYEWDDQGRITAIVMGTQRSEFAYDGMSRRTKITEFTNGTVTSKKLYFWLGGSIVCERDGLQTGFPITKQYFGQGEVRGATKLYYATDHLGSVRELVDSTGAVRAEYSYSTYGEQTKASGDLDSDFAWAGLWNHKASGLYLATYRAYDAANKRWISRDPLGEGVDYNLYRYCGNSPINAVDPMGLDGFTKRKPPKPKPKPKPTGHCPTPPPPSTWRPEWNDDGLDDISVPVVTSVTVLSKLLRFIPPLSIRPQFPTLPPGPAGKMIRDGLSRLDSISGSNRAAALENFLNQVRQSNTNTRGWTFTSDDAEGGARIFESGGGRVSQGIVVDSDGSVWMGDPTVLPQGHNGLSNGWQDAPGWSQVVPPP